MEKIIWENAFKQIKKKKLRLKFNPELALISLRTTGPRSKGEEYLSHITHVGQEGHALGTSPLLFLRSAFNPLSPNIHIQILQTNLYTFPSRISWENLIKDQGIFSQVIKLFINSHNLISGQSMDMVRRKLMLVTIGTKRFQKRILIRERIVAIWMAP